MVAGTFEPVACGEHCKPVAHGYGHVGKVYSKVPYHRFERVAAVAVDYQQTPEPLMVERRHDVGEDGFLGLIAVVDAEFQVALSGGSALPWPATGGSN